VPVADTPSGFTPQEEEVLASKGYTLIPETHRWVHPELTDRWYALSPHEKQIAYDECTARFTVAYAGRRSGKTEIAKRRLVRKALSYSASHDGLFVAAAPTFAQAKSIWWADLKAMVPQWAIQRIINSTLSIYLKTGTELKVMGLDEPARLEGRPIDYIVIDEFASCKMEVWQHHLRPALDTVGRPGSASFIGVPEGRGHYYDLVRKAEADDTGEWEAFHWVSADILPNSVIESARRELDPLVFEQEYEGSFVTFAGAAYHSFSPEHNITKNLPYDPKNPIIICLDFNVSPGVAVVAQEFEAGTNGIPHDFTGIIGEVHIPNGSNTRYVCNKLKEDWFAHEGEVHLHGDATGGARKSSGHDGTDWEIVEQILRPVFAGRVFSRYPRANPSERHRVNSVNARCCSAGENPIRRMFVDVTKAPNVSRDLENTPLVKGGGGQIDKKADLTVSHLSDALGYYITEVHPCAVVRTTRIREI